MEPKIRLKGFSGEWEYKKLSSLTSVRGGYAFQSSLFQKSGIPVVRISNILSNGSVGGDFAYYPKIDGDSNVTLHDKDVVIAMSGATTGKIARVDIGDGVLYQNQRVGLFTKTGKVDYDFLYAVLNRPHFNELLNKLLTSSAQPNASSADIESIEMGFPLDAEEQKALSNYILSLDSLIQSTTKKIESLKQVKAASLQAMFPQEGETTPRVRFKGYEGEWEKVKFAAFAEINRGLTYTPINIVENGVRVLRSSNIDNDVFGISNEDVFVTPNCINICYAKEGDILITAANGSPRLVGKHAIIRNTGSIPVVAGGFMYLVTSQESEFLNASMSSDWYWRFLKIGVAGGNGSIGNLNRNDLEETVFPIPSLKEERNMIASYFTNLDSQITLQTQRLEKLKQIKSACLDNMFV